MLRDPRIAVAAMLVGLACCAVATGASVKLSVASASGAVKSDVAVPLTVAGAQHVAAIQFDLVYDPAILAATSVEKGVLASNTMMESNNGNPGRVRVALISDKGISGDGALVTVHLNALKPGSSKLALENVRAWVVPHAHEGTKGMAHLIDAKAVIEPGTLTVTGGIPSVVILIGVALALVILIALFVRSRRRKNQ